MHAVICREIKIKNRKNLKFQQKIQPAVWNNSSLYFEEMDIMERETELGGYIETCQ